MRQARNLIGNLMTHNMVQGINREYIFKDRQEKLKYLTLVKQYSKKYNVDVISYCVMDNHVHLLLYTHQQNQLSQFMKSINTLYAMYYNKRKDRVGYVFRNRFTSKVILTEKQALACIKYIHMNPVKANLVEQESQYEFSSYHDYFVKSNLVNSNILNFIFQNQENYIEKLNHIPYSALNFEKQKENPKTILNLFLEKENIKIEELRKDKSKIKKFIIFITENEFDITKKEIARILQIGRTKLYRCI